MFQSFEFEILVLSAALPIDVWWSCSSSSSFNLKAAIVVCRWLQRKWLPENNILRSYFIRSFRIRHQLEPKRTLSFGHLLGKRLNILFYEEEVRESPQRVLQSYHLKLKRKSNHLFTVEYIDLKRLVKKNDNTLEKASQAKHTAMSKKGEYEDNAMGKAMEVNDIVVEKASPTMVFMDDSKRSSTVNNRGKERQMADRGKRPMTAKEEYQETRANKKRMRVTSDGLRRLDASIKQCAMYDPSYQGPPPASLQFLAEDSTSVMLPQLATVLSGASLSKCRS